MTTGFVVTVETLIARMCNLIDNRFTLIQHSKTDIVAKSSVIGVLVEYDLHWIIQFSGIIVGLLVSDLHDGTDML